MHIFRVDNGTAGNAPNESSVVIRLAPEMLRNRHTVPQLNEANVRRLLRRTEFVDRDARVAELMALGSIAAAVDNILAVPTNPPSVIYTSLGEDEGWQRDVELAHFWFDRMAHDSSRPMQEKMSLFWHGHFVSDLGKVGDVERMQEQIDLYRRESLGNIREIAITMSTQIAMLRYLDNDSNEKETPNQNFARELLELFLLEVGNYNEADVEAATAAWSGHAVDRETGEYFWRDDRPKHQWEPEYHDNSVKQFLGHTINNGGDPKRHGDETIEVVFGNGLIPADAANVANRGRPSREVAAEFLSRKLWIDFANQTPPPAVITAMRDMLMTRDFDITPWVRVMLISNEFYDNSVKTGLVRSPIDWIVSMLYESGARSSDVTPIWLMGRIGQEPLRPPNVARRKTNEYFVNSSAMEGRARVSQGFAWNASRNYRRGDGSSYIQLRNGRLTQAELIERTPYPDRIPTLSDTEVVDKMVDLMELGISAAGRQHIITHISRGSVWDRNQAVPAIYLLPELHLA
jgi:hypothetical protein